MEISNSISTLNLNVLVPQQPESLPTSSQLTLRPSPRWPSWGFVRLYEGFRLAAPGYTFPVRETTFGHQIYIERLTSCQLLSGQSRGKGTPQTHTKQHITVTVPYWKLVPYSISHVCPSLIFVLQEKSWTSQGNPDYYYWVNQKHETKIVWKIGEVSNKPKTLLSDLLSLRLNRIFNIGWQFGTLTRLKILSKVSLTFKLA